MLDFLEIGFWVFSWFEWAELRLGMGLAGSDSGRDISGWWAMRKHSWETDGLSCYSMAACFLSLLNGQLVILVECLGANQIVVGYIPMHAASMKNTGFWLLQDSICPIFVEWYYWSNVFRTDQVAIGLFENAWWESSTCSSIKSDILYLIVWSVFRRPLEASEFVRISRSLGSDLKV